MAEIDKLVSEINKKYKTDIIRKASDLKSVEFIPYSSPKLNYLTRGGVPEGRMIEYVGLPQSGKTSTALDVLCNYQKKYPKCYAVYLDAENTLDKEWGKTLGVDWGKVILIQPEGGQSGEDLLSMTLDYIRSDKVKLVVIDSAPFIIPKAIMDKDFEDKSYGGNSALMKSYCDKVIPLGKQYNCTILMLNQLRENIGNMYQPFKIPCGTALNHAASEILWFTKGSLLDESGAEVSGKYESPSGNLVNVRMHKNKVTRNDRQLNHYTLTYEDGVDVFADTLDMAINLGEIVQGGAWFTFSDGGGNEVKLQGKKGVFKWFYEHLEEFERLKKEIYKKIL